MFLIIIEHSPPKYGLIGPVTCFILTEYDKIDDRIAHWLSCAIGLCLLKQVKKVLALMKSMAIMLENSGGCDLAGNCVTSLI